MRGSDWKLLAVSAIGPRAGNRSAIPSADVAYFVMRRWAVNQSHNPFTTGGYSSKYLRLQRVLEHHRAIPFKIGSAWKGCLSRLFFRLSQVT